jgi:hypothetical protein
LSALGLRLVVVEDPEGVARLKRHLEVSAAWGEDSVRKRRRTSKAGIDEALDQRRRADGERFQQCQREGGLKRMAGLTSEEKSALGRKAGQASKAARDRKKAAREAEA